MQEYQKVFIKKMEEWEADMAWTEEELRSLRRRDDVTPHILVTHDESTFAQNDQAKFRWEHPTDEHTPMPKNDGKTIMVSDFATPVAGFLAAEDGYASSFTFSGSD